jgi:hypothetical protein
MLTRLKQWLCTHRYDLADLQSRDADGMVSCACYKCGKVDRADCGLHLPGTFDRNTMRERRWRAKLDKAAGGVGGRDGR